MFAGLCVRAGPECGLHARVLRTGLLECGVYPSDGGKSRTLAEGADMLAGGGVDDGVVSGTTGPWKAAEKDDKKL